MNFESCFGVARIHADNSLSPLGTAFCVHASGVYVTAAHVVGGNDDRLTIGRWRSTSIDGYQSSEGDILYAHARIVRYDAVRDLAVLQSASFGDLRRPVCVEGADSVAVGTRVSCFGFPHAVQGRLILTRQDTAVGARVLLSTAQANNKYLILNMQTTPGQSGSPVFIQDSMRLVGIVVGAYVPAQHAPPILGINISALHQTTHAVSAHYLNEMLK